MLSGKRVCIFVDGENLRHSIGDLFPLFQKSKYLPETNWASFFDWIAAEVVGPDVDRIRTYWYTVQNIDFYPFQLNSAKKKNNFNYLKNILSRCDTCKKQIDEKTVPADRDDIIIKLTEKLLERQDEMQRRFDGWTNVQNIIARENNSVEFRRAGAIRYDLFEKKLGSEKAVDVKLATDLVKLKDIYDIAIIVSGDQDYSPAVDAVKDLGKRTVNVSFLTNTGRLLPGGAKRLNQATDWSLEIKYEDSKKYLNL
ncbi:MAG: NYN domain protein [Parcubacteria group bacterium ADurb.Bin115]|nr:MAG: NYN domain protein [Parcubacteria group bacterium ADurb.Bin115]